MADPNSELSQILTTTLREQQKSMTDSVLNNNALFTKMKMNGNIRILDGGVNINEPLTYQENGNFKFYNDLEVLDVSNTDQITSATYEWKQANSNVIMSGKEQRQNAGSNRIIALAEAKVKNTMSTIENNLSIGAYSDGTGSGGKQIGGLQLLVADDPTTGTVGGINRATNPFWRNDKFAGVADGGGAVTATNIIGYMNTLYNRLGFGNQRPDLLVGDGLFFGFYQSALQSQQRFTEREGKLGAAGFRTLMYDTAEVLLENASGIPANHMYFLNTKHLSLTVHPQANMTVGNDKAAVNQDAIVIPILWMGNMTMSNARDQGVLIA